MNTIIDTIFSIPSYTEDVSVNGVDLQVKVDLRIPFLKFLGNAAANSLINVFDRLNRLENSEERIKLSSTPTIDSRAEYDDLAKRSEMDQFSDPEGKTALEAALEETWAYAQIYGLCHAITTTKSSNKFDWSMSLAEMIDFRINADPSSTESTIVEMMQTLRCSRETAEKAAKIEGVKQQKRLAELRPAILDFAKGYAAVPDNAEDIPEVPVLTQLRWINKVTTRVLESANSRILNCAGNKPALRRAETANEFTRAACAELFTLARQIVLDNKDEVAGLLDRGVDIPDNSPSVIQERVLASLDAKIDKMLSTAE